MNFVSHLEAAIDGTRLPAGTLQTTHADRPLWVRYDLDAVASAVSRNQLQEREPSLWRYRELLPVEHDHNVVSLGEGMTPLLECPRLAAEIGLKRLAIKDESQLPTGSFKARGLAMAISMAKELGIQRLAIPTAGNAGGAMAAYAARGGLESYVFMPNDTPAVNRYEASLLGAKAFLVNGLIHNCAQIVREGASRMQWFDLSTLREPYRIEGKKTMGLELAEQCGWRLPDTIFYPTGGGTGLIGMWKAFAELAALGWLDDPKRPQMFSCQSTGCDPISTAFAAGERFATPPEHPQTKASGLRVPKAIGDFMILDAVRESGGEALSGDEAEIDTWMELAARHEGISLCPESAVCLAVLRQAIDRGRIRPDDFVVVFNTGAAQKYVECITRDLATLDYRNVDWSRIESA